MRSLLVAATLALALLLPAAAHAGAPITIGTGTRPSLDVEPVNGAAHVVWTDTSKLTYCRVARGGTGCAITRDLTLPAVTGAPDDAFILRQSANSLIVAMPIYATDKTYLWSSSNNGDSWMGPIKTYDAVGQQPDATRPAFAPPGFTGLVYGSGGVVWRSAGVGDASATAHATLTSAGGNYDFQVARVNAGNQMIAVSNDLDTARVWRTAGGGDPRVQASWSGPATIGSLDTTRLAFGSSGTYLLGSAPGGQEIRRWNTATGAFDGPTVLAAETGYINDVTVGPSGSVAAVWRRNEPSGGNRLRLALSRDGGASYALTTIAREDTVMAGMRVGLASDDGGFAVYEGPSSGAVAPIRLADLSEVPDPVTPGTPGTGSPGTPTTPPPAPPQGSFAFGGKGEGTTIRVVGRYARVVVRGRLKVPAGLTKAQACRGKVIFTVKKGRKLLAVRTVKVRSTCRFEKVVRVARKKVGAAKRLKVIVRFGGNSSVGQRTKTFTVKVRR